MTRKNNMQFTDIDDETIMNLFWERNEKAIQLTDFKYGGFLYKISFRILNDSYDCEECKNDAYLAIWNAIPPHRPHFFQAFIAQIIRRISINKYKEKRRLKNIPSEFAISIEELNESLHSNDNIDSTLEAEELGRIISDYLFTLSAQNRFIFMSRFYCSEKIDEIAKEIGLSTSTVYKALGRMKLGLRKHLERKGVSL